MKEKPEPRAPRRALPVGRFLRLSLGTWLGFAVWPFFRSAEATRIGAVVLVVVGLAAVYALLHALLSSRSTRRDRCLGALLALPPVLLVFLVGGVVGRVGAVGFLAVSLLVAAARADAGCEVMSIPSLVFGRRTPLMCLLFSPLDWVERKIVGALRSSTAGS